MKYSFLAHGKVIIIGEHSVVYGYDALAMPIKALHIKTTEIGRASCRERV